MKIAIIARKPCTLLECPPGLFIHNGELGLKLSDYSHLADRMEAYIVATGERFTAGEDYSWATAEVDVQPCCVVQEDAECQ